MAHIPGQSDSLAPYNNEIWDWIEQGSLQKNIVFNSTLLSNYGKHYVADQYPPTETRVFTAHCITRAMLDSLITKAKTANSCFTVTNRTGFSFTGRFTDLSYNMLGSDSESSAFYSVSLTLRALDFEPADSPRTVYVLSDT